MKWTKVMPDGKGGYNIFDNWTNGDDLGSAILPFIIKIPIFLVFGLLLPGILWLIAPLESEDKMVSNTISGIVASVITLLDFSLGGPIWMFLSEDLTNVYVFFGTLNLAFLFGNLIIARLYYMNIVVLPKLLLAIQVVFIYISYDIFNYLATLIHSDSLCFWMQAFIDYGNTN